MIVKFFDDNLLGQPGLSPYISPNIEWHRDISEYDIALYTDQKCFNSDIDQNKRNFAWIIEPPIINGENYNNIIKNHKKFIKVFSHHLNLSDKIDNFVYIPHGGTWLRDIDIFIYSKTKLISYIFSNKNWNPYHRMRLHLYDILKDNYPIDYYGSGCNNRIDHKIYGLKDYMFSIVVENSIENDYFTEKILDCFLTGTVPIYCGTQNISRYFDKDGIIVFNNDQELVDIIKNLNPDKYLSMNSALSNNFKLAHKYINPENTINEFFK